MKLSIIIPAYNEEGRIEQTLTAYYSFFSQKKHEGLLDFELVIVLNGCVDNTLEVVSSLQKKLDALHDIIIINLTEAGKGIAIREGFKNTLTRKNDLIGFVDADMATLPQHFYDLVTNITNYDGVIASRYMPGAQIFPPRPFYKRWGSRLIFEPYIRYLFGISYYDYQCGAKLFTHAVIQMITPFITVTQWAVDVELLYLCKKFDFSIREIPTVWTDKAESKLTMRGGIKMFKALYAVYKRHHQQ